MRTIAAAALISILATGPSFALDDRPRPNDISMDRARQIVQNAGYTNIYQIEYDDSQWEVEALDANGREFDIDIDAATGEIVRTDPD